MLDIMLHTWPTHNLEKHVNLLQDAIKKGISDADPDARTFARKAYWGFADHFKDQADSLMAGLDPSYKRLLQGEMSQSSSSNSLNILQVELNKHCKVLQIDLGTLGNPPGTFRNL